MIYRFRIIFIIGFFLFLSFLLLRPMEIEKPKVGMPFQTTFMIQRNPLNPSLSRWQNLESISPILVCAVVKAEDRDFFYHHGFDFSSLFSSIFSNFTQGTRYGASTITQQLAKNLYGSIDRTFFGKMLEAWYAIRLEVNLSKEEIIELYLNSIELGEGIWGIENASAYYFNKGSSDLNPAESIVIAGFIASPLQIKVENQRDRMTSLYKRVNYQLMVSGYYDLESYQSLKKIGLELNAFPPTNVSDLSFKYQFTVNENLLSFYLKEGCGLERELKNAKR